MTTTATHAKRKPRDLTELVSLDRRKAAVRSPRVILNSIEQGDERTTVRTLAGPYLKAIHAIRETADQEALESLQATLTNRLERGWELEATPQRDQLFIRLLTDYEIVSDALAESALSPYLSRLGKSA